jgi:hypothetical protein
MPIKPDNLIDLVEAAGGNVEQYSGRGMYGAQCVAVFTGGDDPHGYRFIADMVASEVMDADDMADVLRAMAYDTLGRGAVLYWPRVRPAEWQSAEAEG